MTGTTHRRILSGLVALALACGWEATLAHSGESDEASETDTAVTEPGGAGGFSMVAHTGESVSDASYPGEYLLVVFGFTNCPDICPLDLARMSMAINQLGAAGERVRPLFVTVDPKRDTVERLAEYVAPFHPRLVGLTGTRAQVAATAKAYDVDYIVGEFGGEYLVQHTAGTYLVAPGDRHILRKFRSGVSPGDMSKAIESAMQTD